MSDKMKAQVYYKPGVMKLEERDIPAIKDDEVLVRVKACGICGSDMAYYFGKSALETPTGEGPMILGHEFSGDIAKIGANAAASGILKVGDRVLGNPVQQCSACSQCAQTNFNLCENKVTTGVSVDGAFAEYVVMRHTHVLKIPDGVSYEEASLCEPLACACYGVKKMDIKLGDFVVLYGPGPIGLMQTQLIHSLGAGTLVVVGTRDSGLKKAVSFGADKVFNIRDKNSSWYCSDIVKAIDDLSGGKMADKVLVSTPAKEALQSALKVSGKKSLIVYFGMPADKEILEVPLLDVMMNDKTLLVSWQAPNTWDMAQKAMAYKKVELSSLVTHRFPLAQLEDGLNLMNDPSKTDKIKTVITI